MFPCGLRGAELDRRAADGKDAIGGAVAHASAISNAAYAIVANGSLLHDDQRQWCRRYELPLIMMDQFRVVSGGGRRILLRCELHNRNGVLFGEWIAVKVLS